MATRKPKNTEEYSASDLIALDQHQQLLQNMTMTFGPMEEPEDPWCQQKDVAIREILDNGLDEIRSGHGKKLRLSFYKDKAIEIQDSGRGIPVDIGHDANGHPVSGVYLAMGVMNAGRKRRHHRIPQRRPQVSRIPPLIQRRNPRILRR